ncbi:MAG: glycosyltransferase family 39 protein, partial [Phycisphaerales bacterium]|nr:glycosyltransferase family 39 protein [Phycisphaerales bacterium]
NEQARRKYAENSRGLEKARQWLQEQDPAPLIACWTWTLVLIERSLHTNRMRGWIAAGMLIAIGILAKYTMVLIAPVVLLTLMMAPRLRNRLRQPGIYVCAAIGLTGFVPILIWNMQHGWVSFRHMAGQAGVGGAGLRPLGLLEYVAGQAIVLNPFWLLLLAPAIGEWLRRPAARADETHSEHSMRYLLSAAIVPWLFFVPFSFVTKIQPNWPAPATIAAIPLVIGWGRRRMKNTDSLVAFRSTLITGAATGLLTGLVLHRTELLLPLLRFAARAAPSWELTPAAKFDPTSRLRGWSKLAAIDGILAHEAADGRDPFIMTDDYQLASQIAFYCPSHPRVFCAQAALGQRQSQYDIWPNPIRDAEQFIGRTCIYVGQLDARVTEEGGKHAALPGLRKIATIEHFVDGLRYQLWPVFACDAYAGFSVPSDRHTRY